MCAFLTGKKKRNAWQPNFMEYIWITPYLIYAFSIMMTSNGELFNTMVSFVL